MNIEGVHAVQLDCSNKIANRNQAEVTEHVSQPCHVLL